MSIRRHRNIAIGICTALPFVLIMGLVGFLALRPLPTYAATQSLVLGDSSLPRELAVDLTVDENPYKVTMSVGNRKLVADLYIDREQEYPFHIIIDDEMAYINLTAIPKTTFSLNLSTIGHDFNQSIWSGIAGTTLDEDLSIDVFSYLDYVPVADDMSLSVKNLNIQDHMFTGTADITIASDDLTTLEIPAKTVPIMEMDIIDIITVFLGDLGGLLSLI